MAKNAVTKCIKNEKVELTKEDIIKMFPDKKNTLRDETIQYINEALNDDEFNPKEIMTAMNDYTSVMYKNSASLKDFINAIKFAAAYITNGGNAYQAYTKARKNDEFVQKRLGAKSDTTEYIEIQSAASRYLRTNLVKDILVQADLPLHLMLVGLEFKAAMVLAHEMETAKFSRDRINAADKLMTHIANSKPAEVQKIDIDINGRQESMIDKYSQMIDKLVDYQQKEFEKKDNKDDVVNVDIIDIEPEG